MTEERSEKRMMRNDVRQSHGGFALVTVLLIVSLLAVISITLSRSGGMQSTISHNLNHGEEAYYIANAGLQHAVFLLSNNPTATGTILSDVPFSNGSYTVSVTSDVTPMGQVLVSSTGNTGTAVRTIEKRLFPTSFAYPVLLMDTTIDKEEREFNYGVSPYVNIGITSTDRQRRALFAFDLSSLPAGIVIKSAFLELYMYGRERSIIGDNVINSVAHRMNGPWVEGIQDGAQCTVGATWRDSDCSNTWTGGDYDSIIETAVIVTYEDINTWHSWNITGLVQYWYDNPSGNYGVLIKDEMEMGNTETFVAHFASAEYPDVNLRPKLTVYYRLP